MTTPDGFAKVEFVRMHRDKRIYEGTQTDGSVLRCFLKKRQRITTAWWVFYPGMKTAGLWD